MLPAPSEAPAELPGPVPVLGVLSPAPGSGWGPGGSPGGRRSRVCLQTSPTHFAEAPDATSKSPARLQMMFTI